MHIGAAVGRCMADNRCRRSYTDRLSRHIARFKYPPRSTIAKFGLEGVVGSWV